MQHLQWRDDEKEGDQEVVGYMWLEKGAWSYQTNSREQEMFKAEIQIKHGDKEGWILHILHRSALHNSPRSEWSFSRS